MRRFLLVLGCAVFTSQPQARAAEPSVDEPTTPLRPVVAGYGVESFTVGEQLYATDFDDPENWDIQLQERADSPLKGRFAFADGMLDIYAPNTGCTAWLKRDFEGPLAIVYRFRCPKETQRDEGISPRDANNFWMASDPDPKGSLFDRTRYTGDFGDYSRMHAYYASSGGRKNSSVRMRRYPHQNKAGKGITHLALTAQDGNRKFLLTAGKWHTVQLVAFNDIIQYFFDGQLVYEMRAGDRVRIERNKKETQGAYDVKRFPPYTHGYFGFRLTSTHHQHKDFAVYRLDAK